MTVTGHLSCFPSKGISVNRRVAQALHMCKEKVCAVTCTLEQRTVWFTFWGMSLSQNFIGTSFESHASNKLLRLHSRLTHSFVRK